MRYKQKFVLLSLSGYTGADRGDSDRGRGRDHTHVWYDRFDAGNISEFDQEIIFKFYKCECFGFAMDWLNNGMEEEAQAQIDRFCEYQTRLFEELLALKR